MKKEGAMSIYGSVLLCLCSIDLLFTTIGIQAGYCTEYNPFLLWYLGITGIYGLIVIKLFLNSCSLFAVEMAYRYRIGNPKIKIETWYRVALVTYFIGIIIGLLKANLI